MKANTDLYTKVILTVIAVFLGIIVVRDISFVEKAQATSVPAPTSETIDVNIVEVNGYSIWGSDLPVKVKD